MSKCYQSLNDLTINIIPNKKSNKKAHIIGIDISGSMGEQALITDENKKKNTYRIFIFRFSKTLY